MENQAIKKISVWAASICDWHLFSRDTGESPGFKWDWYLFGGGFYLRLYGIIHHVVCWRPTYHIVHGSTEPILGLDTNSLAVVTFWVLEVHCWAFEFLSAWAFGILGLAVWFLANWAYCSVLAKPLWALIRDIFSIRLYRSCYIDPLKWDMWVLTREWTLAWNTMVLALLTKLM